jgi:hypothetical protein
MLLGLPHQMIIPHLMSNSALHACSTRLTRCPARCSRSIHQFNDTRKTDDPRIAHRQRAGGVQRFVNENSMTSTRSTPFQTLRSEKEMSPANGSGETTSDAQERELTVDGISVNIFAFANYFLSFGTVLCVKSVFVTGKLYAYAFEGV